MGVGHFGDLAIVVLGDQLGDGAPPIPQEPVRRLRALHHHARQRRQPGPELVAAPAGELGGHVLGPGLRAGLDAVGEQGAHALAAEQVGAGGGLIGLQIVFQIGPHVCAAQLVDLQPRRLGRGRVGLGPRQGVADPQHGPGPRRRGPVQSPVGSHLGGDVDHVRRLRRAFAGSDGIQGVVVQCGGEAGLLLEAVHRRVLPQRQLVHDVSGRTGRGHRERRRRGAGGGLGQEVRRPGAVGGLQGHPEVPRGHRGEGDGPLGEAGGRG